MQQHEKVELMDESYPHTLVNRLYENRLMRSQAEVDRFIATMRLLEQQSGALPIRPISDLLPALLRVFDDQSELPEVLWSLLHYIEDYDMDEYLTQLTNSTSDLVPSAVGWMGLLYFHIILSDAYRDALIALLPSLSAETLRALEQVMTEIESEYDREAATVQDIKSKITTLLSSDNEN